MTSLTIPANTQLKTFDIIKNVIRSNATLNQWFTSSDFYEFEPKVKSPEFNGFPYFIISIPQTDKDEMYLGNVSNDKEFTVEIQMVVEYDARDKVSRMASEVLNSLRGSNSHFRSYRYEFGTVSMSDTPALAIISQKDCIIAEFELVLKGEVSV